MRLRSPHAVGDHSSKGKKNITIIGSGVISGKMLLVRIVESNKIDDYIGQVRLSKG